MGAAASSTTSRGSAGRSGSYAAIVAIQVVFADDHYLVREGVRRLLETEPEIDVVAVYADLDSLLEGVAAELPDVVLTDILDGPPAGKALDMMESTPITGSDSRAVAFWESTDWEHQSGQRRYTAG